MTRLVLRPLVVIGSGLLAILVSGCGGGIFGGGGPGFNIASGNWVVPLNTGGTFNSSSVFAWGLLTQNGGRISGILHISGSPCFDPVADALSVQGTVSSDANAANALTFTTSPVRGQVLSLSAGWNQLLNPGLPPPTSPPNPVMSLVGNWTLSGGACAATGGGEFDIADFGNKWIGEGFTAVMSQTGPDAQGFSQVSGTFSVTNSPCFTSGTIANNTTFAGDIREMNVNMDSGVLTGSGQITKMFFAGATATQVSFNFVVHGGTCDGQSVTFTSNPL